MIETGFSLAVLTAGGFYLLYRKLPVWMRDFMQKHVLLTDLTACFLTYALFGGTIVALFAAAWVGLMVSTVLAITSNKKSNAVVEYYVAKLYALVKKAGEWVSNRVPNPESPVQLKIVKD